MIGRIFAKTMLLPIMFLIFAIRTLFKIAMELSSVIIGGALLLFLGFLIHALVNQTWSNALILFMTECGLVLLTVCAGTVDGLLDLASEMLGDFMLS